MVISSQHASAQTTKLKIEKKVAVVLVRIPICRGLRAFDTLSNKCDALVPKLQYRPELRSLDWQFPKKFPVKYLVEHTVFTLARQSNCRLFNRGARYAPGDA
jgi:hypothetical protein